MALTKISRGLLNTGVSDSSDANAITISSAEKVTVANSLNAPTSIQTPLIEFTDGDDAIAIADGGAVTMAKVGAIGATTAGTGAFTTLSASGNLTVGGNLTVTGTSTVVDTVTMNAQNAVIFEGATADNYETTLSIVDPTADHTQYLINQDGYIPVLAAVSTTAISSTPAELNILDGVTSTTAELNLLDGSVANTVVNSKGVIYGSSGELAGTLSTAAQTNITSLGTLTSLGVDSLTLNGTSLTSSGNLTVDVTGDINLDAGGGDWNFKDDGTTIGFLANSSSDFWIGPAVQDKDLIFRGNDGGSQITALTLDMSEAGKATFNAGVDAAPNADTVSVFGRTAIGFVSGLSDYAMISHYDRQSSSNYALLQSASGSTYLNGTDVNLSIGGTRKVVVDSSGNVGIGITSPVGNLQVQGSSASTYTGGGPTTIIRASQSTAGAWIASDFDGAFAYMGNDSSTTGKFAAYNYATSAEMNMILGQNRMYIKNDGKVGIGTASPVEKLHLGGTAPGDSIIRQDATSSGTNWEIGERAAGKYQFWEDDNDGVRLTIMSTGKVGIGTESPDDLLDIMGGGYDQIRIGSNKTDNTNKLAGIVSTTYTNQSLSLFQGFFQNGNNTLYYGSADGAHRGMQNHVFYVNSNYNATSGHTEAMRIISSGNVGIGTTAPAQKLHVSGGSGAGTSVQFGEAYDTSLYIKATNTASAMLRFQNASDTVKYAVGYRNDSNAGPFRIRAAATLDSGGHKWDFDAAGAFHVIPSNTAANVHITASGSGNDAAIVMATALNARGMYVDDSAVNTLKFYTGYGKGVANREIFMNNDGDLAIGATRKLYLDGQGDTYITEYGANEIGFYTGGTQRVKMSGGNLYALGHVYSGHASFGGYPFHAQTANGDWSVGPQNSSYCHHTTDRGINYWGTQCQASGGFSTYSDERLKEEITTITGALDSVVKMEGITFKWKDPEKRGGNSTGKQFGVTAQNMLTIDTALPTLNVDPLAEAGKEESDDKFYTMDYSRLTPYFIEAIKELSAKNAELEEKLNIREGELEQRVHDLEQRLV